MSRATAVLPPTLITDQSLREWLIEDIGRGDRATQSILAPGDKPQQAEWIVKEAGIIAGLPIALRVFPILDPFASYTVTVTEGQWCERGQVIAQITGSLDALLTGERVALNLAMRLSGIATATYSYVAAIADLPTKLVDTRKTTPGLRIFEKYASRVGGAINHRMGLDDGVMLKDNHIVAVGNIREAVKQTRSQIPYPLTIEVETENLEQVEEVLSQDEVDIIMLDNMPIETMREAIHRIRRLRPTLKVEASGNITLETIRSVAETGVDFISTSAPITRSSWLDLSMKLR
ncbi:MAG: carboxylating nicotinate-nucleotide diphosphorylase [Synechococcales cyanobacterium T60_A2020_003]|nr:carboxylating nicotinate-nucleotide diphosphorylase [Synechococcales cyanobacterium T60_A2020_003]